MRSVIALLSLITVVSWGTWIPLAQAAPGVPQRTRIFYVTAGNLVFAGAALVVAGGHLAWGWRSFWLPVAGGLVWTLGNYSAFRAAETIGLARAAGSWTPLNIVVAFVWGAALFGELDGLSSARFAVLGGALVLVVAGVLVIVRSQDAGTAGTPPPSARLAAGRQRSRAATSVSRGADQHRRGLLWAAAAGLLWGSYFVPAQSAGVTAQVSNFPLAVGMLAGGLALLLTGGEPVRLPAAGATANLAAGLLFGIGNLALLSLVSRVGTGVGFTIAQLSLLVNASIGIWLFKVPPPGSRAAKLATAGILIAGTGGALIGALR
jgi:glucose uptake protein